MHKQKGIVCIGCSHTWGGGLEWYYPNKKILEKIANSDWTYDSKDITYATYKFINANRWSRLVANKLNLWEVNRMTNSGSDEGSIEFLKYIFSMEKYKDGNINYSYMAKEDCQKYEFDDIEYVIFQLTDPFRNNNYYIDDQKIEVNIAKIRYRDKSKIFVNKIENFKDHLDEQTYNDFFNFYMNNFSSFEDMENYFCKQNLDSVEALFKELEKNGIKCRIWTWQNEYIPFLEKNEYFNKRWIKFKYDNKHFNSLTEMFTYNPKLLISKSDYNINGFKIYDDHQTLECHKITANSIVDFIQNEITYA